MIWNKLLYYNLYLQFNYNLTWLKRIWSRLIKMEIATWKIMMEKREIYDGSWMKQLRVRSDFFIPTTHTYTSSHNDHSLTWVNKPSHTIKRDFAYSGSRRLANRCFVPITDYCRHTHRVFLISWLLHIDQGFFCNFPADIICHISWLKDTFL